MSQWNKKVLVHTGFNAVKLSSLTLLTTWKAICSEVEWKGARDEAKKGTKTKQQEYQGTRTLASRREAIWASVEWHRRAAGRLAYQIAQPSDGNTEPALTRQCRTPLCTRNSLGARGTTEVTVSATTRGGTPTPSPQTAATQPGRLDRGGP